MSGYNWSPQQFRRVTEEQGHSSDSLATILWERGYTITPAGVRLWWRKGSRGPTHQALAEELVRILAGKGAHGPLRSRIMPKQPRLKNRRTRGPKPARPSQK